MKNLYFLLYLSFISSLVIAQSSTPPVHYTRERSYDVLHYKLNITVDEKEKTCAGDVSIKLMPLRPLLDEVRLDAADMQITGVRLEKQQLDFHSAGETLFVVLDKPYGIRDTLNLTVSYSVMSPKKGMYFITPDSGYPNKQYQVWTQGEAEDNHYWFPCYDFPNDLATSEMIVTVKDRFTAISNGKLLDVKKNAKSHTSTYHWLENSPHVSYLISLIVGEYAEVKDVWGNVPISNYVAKHQQADAMRSFGKTPKMMEFFSTKIGYSYPWEKLAQTVVEDFIYGGQENVSAITLTDATVHDARAHLDYSSDGLVAHELSHQWWGDLLTCRDWSHAWLNEGFATYFENLFTEFDLGKDDAAKEIMDNQIVLRNVDTGDRRRPTVCSRYFSPMDVFDNRIYGKGAVVLNMLRFVLGDELFWKSINRYIHKFAFQNVETNDFKVAVEEATGYNLYWFFDQWLYKAGCPEFEIVSKWDQQSRNVQLTVRQVQKVDSLTGIFITPVEIEVWVNGNPETYRVKIANAEESFSFPAYQQPQLIIFDKGSKLLKKVNFHKSLDEWIFQFLHAEDGVDRLQAIDELRWRADSSNVAAALCKAAFEDKFWAVRQDAIGALGDAKQDRIADTIVAAYGDRNARVRAACVASLGYFKGEKVLQTLRHAFGKDSSYSVAASALRSLMKVDSVNRTTYLNEGLKRDSRDEIIRNTSLQLIADIGYEHAVDTVASYTRYGVDRNLRIQAVHLLASKWKERDDVLYLLIRMLADPSFHVRRTVINTLGDIGDQRALDPLRKCVEQETDSRVVKDAQDAIEKIQKAHKK